MTLGHTLEPEEPDLAVTTVDEEENVRTVLASGRGRECAGEGGVE